MALPNITIYGRLTAEPELKYTNSGIAYATFTVAMNQRVKDKNTGEWVEGDTLFQRVTVWKQLAENVAESLTKGSLVLVYGKQKQNNWTDKNGNNRESIQIDGIHVGVSLAYATAKPVPNPKPNQGQGQGWTQNQNQVPPNWGQNQGQGWGQQPPPQTPPASANTQPGWGPPSNQTPPNQQNQGWANSEQAPF